MAVDFERDVAALITRAFEEDLPDPTSLYTFAAADRASAIVLAKAEGVLAGMDVARRVFVALDPTALVTEALADGARLAPGLRVAHVAASARGLLGAERTALNILMRLSGIATLTRRFADAVAATKAVILDTRKTTPGLRALEKYAVRVGGGANHRMGLYDMILLKDNHIDRAGGIRAAVGRVREGMAAQRRLDIEVECRTLAEVGEALGLDVERIMLDNMNLGDMRAAVGLAAGRVPLEASGGVSLASVGAIAQTGVDFISVGALTHSAAALDLSLDVVVSP